MLAAPGYGELLGLTYGIIQMKISTIISRQITLVFLPAFKVDIEPITAHVIPHGDIEEILVLIGETGEAIVITEDIGIADNDTLMMLLR